MLGHEVGKLRWAFANHNSLDRGCKYIRLSSCGSTRQFCEFAVMWLSSLLAFYPRSIVAVMVSKNRWCMPLPPIFMQYIKIFITLHCKYAFVDKLCVHEVCVDCEDYILGNIVHLRKQMGMQYVNTISYLSSKNFIWPFMVVYAVIFGVVGRPGSIRNVDSSSFSRLLLGISQKKNISIASNCIFVE